MRELKFRAWDTRKNRWYHKIIQWVFDKPNGSIGFLPILPSDIVLQQYTGLKDTNGKDIYEGDICKDDQCPKDNMSRKHYGQVTEVVWKDWAGGWRFKHGESIHENYVEVVGNIYENPELLEET